MITYTILVRGRAVNPQRICCTAFAGSEKVRLSSDAEARGPIASPEEAVRGGNRPGWRYRTAEYGLLPGLVTLAFLAVVFVIYSIRSEASSAITIPKESDWTEYGVVLEGGPVGSWDFLFAGASTPSTLIKHNGVYYLYNGGADGYRSTDGGPRHRAIGVAYGPDGIHYTKYPGNPVMTHLPNNGEEEGANSAGVALDSAGQFIMYYGAATEAGIGSIIADGRVAVSSDGLEYTDLGVKVLDHADPNLYGYGDEIFPLATYTHGNQWYVFYVSNGRATSRDVGVAWGPTIDYLPDSTLVVDGNDGNPAHVPANVIWLDPNQILLFVQRRWWPNTIVELRTADAATPWDLSDPLEIYDSQMWNEDTKFFTVHLDTQKDTWFLYRTNWNNQIILHLAPNGPPDTSPPTSPPNLTGTRVGPSQIDLAWDPADDPHTGVVAYNIYRDGIKIGTTLDWSFSDNNAPPTSPITYDVTAINLHGTEGPPATLVMGGTPSPTPTGPTPTWTSTASATPSPVLSATPTPTPVPPTATFTSVPTDTPIAVPSATSTPSPLPPTSDLATPPD